MNQFLFLVGKINRNLEQNKTGSSPDISLSKNTVTAPLTFHCDRKNSIRNQGRSDGVSRVSNAYGPIAKGGPQKEKIYTRYF